MREKLSVIARAGKPKYFGDSIACALGNSCCNHIFRSFDQGAVSSHNCPAGKTVNQDLVFAPRNYLSKISYRWQNLTSENYAHLFNFLRNLVGFTTAGVGEKIQADHIRVMGCFSSFPR